LEQSILDLQRAVDITPEEHRTKAMCLTNLGLSQQSRFQHLGELTDLDYSISNLRKAVDLTPEAHHSKPMYLSNLGLGQEVRFKRFGMLVDLEHSILNLQTAVNLTPEDHEKKGMYLSNLGLSQRHRFERLGQPIDLEYSLSNLRDAVGLTNDHHPNKAIYLINLGLSQQHHFICHGELGDIEESISNLQKAVNLTNDEHSNKPSYLTSLGLSQRRRFERLRELADLEHSITNLRKAANLAPEEHPDRSVSLLSLGLSQQLRFECLGEPEDFSASISAFRIVAQMKTTYPRQAFMAAEIWADTLRKYGHLSSALDGYRTALEILPKLAWLGLDIASRQDWVLRANSEDLGCIAANCAIQVGRLEEAVELLDLSRSVFWQQASSLRGDLEMLKEDEPELAEKLESIGRKLDTWDFSDSTLVVLDKRISGHHHDPTKERRGLVAIWEALLERVRQLPKFEHFLKPIPFHRLRQATNAGQVVIINVSPFGVDALTFDATHPIEHTPLPDIDSKTLAEMSAAIQRRRLSTATVNQSRSYTTRYLKSALRTVWDDVLVPIFNKIQVPLDNALLSRRRIWWYPTGPLTFLPIHAAGPGRGPIDVSRLVVSSYVTTLDSLYQAQKRNMQNSPGQRKFLSISQPDTPGQSSLPRSAEEVEKVIEVACSAGWPKEHIIHLTGSDATVSRTSCALDACSWAHFACHGIQDPLLGTKSAFALHDGGLELGLIASKRLSMVQFAFLSVCHAASGLKGHPGEAMHLAAGVQFAGFPSVIATMWGIRDDDAPKVASLTYQYLFRNGLQNCDPSEAAAALNHAVAKLRDDPSVTVDRWAPFIHFGI
jgi:CHAT domain-containing protein/tetratricopeptide (TPR) repeat protein